MGDRIKVLNAYAGVGGNRKLWGDEVQVTAVEYNPQIYEAMAGNHFLAGEHELPNKRQVLRNCVYPPLGDYVMRVALDKMGVARDKGAERHHMQGVLI